MEGRRGLTLMGLILAVLLLLGAVGSAPANGPYGLDWWTVDGGGYTFSTGGAYTLGGTVGQPDAGVLTGGDYTLGGGFWCGGEVAVAQKHVYLPLVLRNLP